MTKEEVEAAETRRDERNEREDPESVDFRLNLPDEDEGWLDRNAPKLLAIAAGIFFLYTIIIGIGVWKIIDITSGHNKEIKNTAISAANTEKAVEIIRRVQKDDSNGRKTTQQDETVIGADADKIIAAVASVESTIATNHLSGNTGQQQICNSVNGIITQLHLNAPLCVVPSP